MVGTAIEGPVNIVLQHDTASIMLPKGEIRVGRGPGCFLRIDDPNVSRVHFAITVGDDAVIADLGSRNGTLLNGHRLQQPQTLRDGDAIAIGSRVFHIAVQTPEAALYDDCQETPAPSPHFGTLLGVGVLELGESCPSCHEQVALHAPTCLACGFEWPRAKRHAVTESQAPALSLRTMASRSVQHHTVTTAHYTSANMATDVTLMDLALDGAFLSADRLDSLGVPCTIQVQRSDGSPVSLRGFVQRTIRRAAPGRPAGMGIQFAGLDADAESWLNQHLEGAIDTSPKCDA